MNPDAVFLAPSYVVCPICSTFVSLICLDADHAHAIMTVQAKAALL